MDFLDIPSQTVPSESTRLPRPRAGAETEADAGSAGNRAGSLQPPAPVNLTL